MEFYPFLDKSSYFWKWAMVVFCVWIAMGAHFCHDVPTGLHNSMQEYFSDMIHENEFEVYFSGLFSLCALANIFLPSVNGRFRDRIGDRSVLIGLVLFILVGQGIFAYGMMKKSFFIIYSGRILASWGTESITSTQLAFISPYFKNDHLGLVSGINQLFATFGSIAVLYYCPKIAIQYGIVMAVTSGTIFNIYSLICTFICVLFDKDADKEMLLVQDYESVRQQSISQYWSLSQNQNYTEQDMDFIDEDQSFTLFEQMKQLGSLYWLVAIFNSLIYNSGQGFSNISVAYLSERFGHSESKASELAVIMWVCYAVSTIIVGRLLDEYSQRTNLCIFTALICTTAQMMIWYDYPILSLLFIGLSLSCVHQAAWASIVNLVRPDALGKAYAFSVSLDNIGATIVPFVVGVLRANTGNYFYSQIFLASLGGIGFIISLILYKFDKYKILDGGKI